METMLHILGVIFGAVCAFFVYKTGDALLGLIEIEREYFVEFAIQYFLKYLVLVGLFGGMAIFLLTR